VAGREGQGVNEERREKDGDEKGLEGRRGRRKGEETIRSCLVQETREKAIDKNHETIKNIKKRKTRERRKKKRKKRLDGRRRTKPYEDGSASFLLL
jgi:hypothetical protein